MLGFTRQEQKFILFLLVSFVIGLGIELYKKGRSFGSRDEWAAEHERIVRQFRQVAAKAEDGEPISGKGAAAQELKKRLTAKVNINTADVELLQTLPGIGPSTALKIVHYRQRQGPFRKVEDIQNVKGIGPKKFEKIKMAITVK